MVPNHEEICFTRGIHGLRGGDFIVVAESHETLRKNLLLGGIPKRRIDAADGRIDHVEFRATLRPRRRRRHADYQCHE